MTDQTTPMMGQYRRIRGEVSPDTILFFRLGDFYEMFFDDAKEASRILDIALTKRQTVPMCGVPYHAADFYLAKLIKAGKKVAICDQMEDPATAQGIVRREVTRIITPGTVLEENVLESSRNNFLAGLCQAGERFGLALLDLSTGTFWVEESASLVAIQDNLMRYAPAECVIPDEKKDDPKFGSVLGGATGTMLSPYEDWTFEQDAAVDLLTRHFGVHSLMGFGCDGCTAALGAAGAVLHYVTHELRRQVGHIRRLSVKNPADYMRLDEATVSNLDLISSRSPGRAGSATHLLRVLDTTRTAMGGRLLRDWLLRPLTDLKEIGRRHDAVETLVKDRKRLADLRDAMAQVKDLERLIARLGAGSGNGRDLKALSVSLASLPELKKTSGRSRDPLIGVAGRCHDPAAGAGGPDRAGDGRRAAGVDSGRRDHPQGLPRGTRRAARRGDGGPKVAGGFPGARAGAHRHQVAEGPPQQGVRLLHRDHQKQARRRARGLHPQADARQRRAVHHAGAQGVREQDPRRAGAVARAGIRAVRGSPERGGPRDRANPAVGRRDRAAGRPSGAGRARAGAALRAAGHDGRRLRSGSGTAGTR